MQGPLRIARATVPVLALAGLCAISRGRPIAPQGAAEPLTVDARDMPTGELLHQLCVQIHRPVVLDDHRPAKVSLHFEGTPTEVLKAIGRSLDIDVRRGRNGAVLLIRKFDRDLSPPQARPEQIHALAENALRILPHTRPFTDPHDWTDDVRAFAATLGPDQVAALKSGRRLGWTNLAPRQREKLAEALDARLYGMPRYAWSLVFLASQDPSHTRLILADGTDNLVLEVRGVSGVSRAYLGIALGGGK